MFLIMLIFLNDIPDWITTSILMFTANAKLWTMISSIDDAHQTMYQIFEDDVTHCLQYIHVEKDLGVFVS